MFDKGRKANKNITARTQTGMGNSGSNPVASTAPLTTWAQTSSKAGFFKGETESKKTLAGPGDGNYATGNSGNSQKWGWSSPMGNSFIIDDSPGGETITANHHTGATVTIDPDGGIYIVAGGRRGVGISAPFGDAYVTASGDVVIDGAQLNLISKGDMVLESGGNMLFKSKTMQVFTSNMEEIVDGSASRSVTNDESIIIGGIKRETIAGDERHQVSGGMITDVGGNIGMRATGSFGATAQGDAIFGSSGLTSIHGSTVHLSDIIQMKGNLTVDGLINATDTIGSNVSCVAPVHPTASVGASGVDGFSGSVDEAQVMEPNDIVDTLTSQRKYPDFPDNAIYYSAEGGSHHLHTHEEGGGGNSYEQVYQEYMEPNQGNVNPINTTNIGNDSNPIQPTGAITQAFTPDTNVPAKGNSNVKISRYFTLGDIIHAPLSHEIPNNIYEQVVKEHIRAAYNVLDPLKEKFPGMKISSAWRENSTNHITGRAIDILGGSADISTHAEMARFALGLPCEKILLEAHSNGTTHLHIQVSKEGSSASPRVFTCADPACHTLTPGIDVNYLTRRGVR